MIIPNIWKNIKCSKPPTWKDVSNSMEQIWNSHDIHETLWRFKEIPDEMHMDFDWKSMKRPEFPWKFDSSRRSLTISRDPFLFHSLGQTALSAEKSISIFSRLPQWVFRSHLIDGKKSNFDQFLVGNKYYDWVTLIKGKDLQLLVKRN